MTFHQSAFSKVLAVVTLSVSMTGCIFEEQGIFAKDKDKTDGDAQSVKVVTFGFGQTSSQIDYIERADIKISQDHTQTTEKVLFGKAKESSTDSKSNYLLADALTIETSDNYRKAAEVTIDDKLAYHLLWKDKETASTLREDIDYQAVDLSGQSGVTGHTANTASKGFTTILNRLPATQSASFSFPLGAECYVMRHQYDKDQVRFSTGDVTDYNRLMDWQGDQSFKSDIAQLSVGSDNDVEVSYIVNMPKVDEDSGIQSYRGAVQWAGKVYSAKVIPAQKTQLNTDANQGLVKCQAYNKVAADFIESEIKRVY
ncbi:MAG: hypothetical protein Q4P13_10155 [Psychrobacter sp.]|nr:hypothetical protein [Psychrobacter sp.]